MVARVIREMADWADVAPEVEMRLESWVSSRSRSAVSAKGMGTFGAGKLVKRARN